MFFCDGSLQIQWTHRIGAQPLVTGLGCWFWTHLRFHPEHPRICWDMFIRWGIPESASLWRQRAAGAMQKHHKAFNWRSSYCGVQVRSHPVLDFFGANLRLTQRDWTKICSACFQLQFWGTHGPHRFLSVFLVHHSVIVNSQSIIGPLPCPNTPGKPMQPTASHASCPDGVGPAYQGSWSSKSPFCFFWLLCGVCGLFFVCLLFPLLHLCVVLSHFTVRTCRRSKKCGGRQSQDEMVGIFRAQVTLALCLASSS